MFQKDQLLSTSDYSIFHKVQGNRKISKSHVETLVKSIEIENRLHLHPIIVKELGGKFYIIDGQHRLEAAAILRIPIYYLYDEGSLETAIIIDQVQRSWKLPDYLNFFCDKKLPEYTAFRTHMLSYGMNMTSMMSIIGSNMFQIGRVFKQGKLVLKKSAKEFIVKTYECRKHIENKSSGWKATLYRRDFMLALKWFYIMFPGHFNGLLNDLMNHFGEITPKTGKKTYEFDLISLANSNSNNGKKKIIHPSCKKEVEAEEKFHPSDSESDSQIDFDIPA